MSMGPAGRIGYVRFIVAVINCTMATTFSVAQEKDHATWKVDAVRINEREAMIRFEVTIDSTWRIYSQVNPIEDARIQFLFEKAEGYDLMGTATEEAISIEKFDNAFGRPLKVFERHAVFSQRVMLHHGHQLIKGSIRFVVSSANSFPKAQGLLFSVGVSTISKNSQKVRQGNH